MKFFLLTLSCFVIHTSSLQAANKVWTCINSDGEELFNLEALNTSDFKNNRAKIYKNNYINNEWIKGYGFIDKTGKVIIDCTLKAAKDFDAPVTWVKYTGDDFYTLIDLNGHKIETKPYTKVGQFYSDQTDICAVFEGQGMGFINSAGKEIIPCQYIGGSIFQYNLLSVARAHGNSSLYGFIDKKGEQIIPMKYKQAGTSSFEDGLARAQLPSGATVLIDTTGAIVFKTNKGNIQGHSGGLVMVFKNRTNRTEYGWLNLKDEFVIDPIYDHAENFNEDGFAIVTMNGKKGLIDRTGKVLLEPKYEDLYADCTGDGYIMGTYPSNEPLPLSKREKDFYKKNLEQIPLPTVMYLLPKKSGNLIPFKSSNQLMGFLNLDFQITIVPQYKKVKPFSENLAWVIKQ